MNTSAPEPRVVVGIDGSPISRRVLAEADRERRARSAHLQVIGVWRLPTTYGWALPSSLVSDLRAQARKVVMATIRDVLGDPMPTGVSVSIDEGHPAAVLGRAAVGAELLVVGSRGTTTLPGIRLGSVSAHLAHTAPCPLLIVPASVTATNESSAPQNADVPAPA